LPCRLIVAFQLSAEGVTGKLSQVGPHLAEIDVKLTDKNLQNVIYSKARAWEYEREWRLVAARGGCEQTYPGPLREIILVLRCDGETRQKIAAAVHRHLGAGGVKLREIRLQPNSFDIVLDDLPSEPQPRLHSASIREP
jgi:hypothetical protein